MPNWVKCRLKMDGLNDAPLFTVDERGEREFDFNKLIPMPEALNMDSGYIETMAIRAYLTFGDNEMLVKAEKTVLFIGHRGIPEDYKISMDDLTEYCESRNMTTDALLEIGKQYCVNCLEHGSTTWYDWRISKWGTKWNAKDTEVISDDMIGFETAWSAPIPVIRKLSEKYPDRVVMLEWADEDMGFNVGQIALQNGDLALDECGCEICNNVPDGGTSEAYEIYEKLWGDTKCLDRDEDGKLYQRNCEDCDGCD